MGKTEGGRGSVTKKTQLKRMRNKIVDLRILNSMPIKEIKSKLNAKDGEVLKHTLDIN